MTAKLDRNIGERQGLLLIFNRLEPQAQYCRANDARLTDRPHPYSQNKRDLPFLKSVVFRRNSMDRKQAPVAQLDRALPSEGRGQRFKSSRVRQSYQWVRFDFIF